MVINMKKYPFSELKVGNWYVYNEGFAPFKVLEMTPSFSIIHDNNSVSRSPAVNSFNPYSYFLLISRTIEDSFNKWLNENS